jgi:hypothetical protein
VAFSVQHDRLLDQLGADFLAYVCGAEREAIVARLVSQDPLPPVSEEALDGALEFADAVASAPRPMVLNNRPTYEPLGDALREACARFLPAFGMSYPNALRLASGGLTTDGGPDLPAAEAAAASVLADAFPAYLLPPPARGATLSFERYPRPDFGHPGQAAFFGALADDDPLRGLFPLAHPLSPPAPSEPRIADAVYVRMSYGGEAALSAFGFFGDLAANAYERAAARGELTPQSFVSAGLEALDELRSLAAGDEVLIPVITELACSAEPGFELKTELGTLRARARPTEPNPFPDHVPTTTGDLLAEIRVPLQLHVVGPAPSGVPPRSEAQRWLENLSRAIDQIRLALLLSADGTAPPATRLLSSTICLPVDTPMRSHSLASPFPFTRIPSGAVARAASPHIAAATRAVAQHHVPSLDIATRRVLSAHADRVDPADGLIDAIVALESLFGTGQGEVTLRLSVALARLLESDPARRRERMRQVRDLYGLRSKISHGVRVKASDLIEGHHQAAALALEVFQTLFFRRPELIAASEPRELAVMLDDGVSES